MLGFAVALTILVNVFMLQRRFRPLERLVDEMERADLSRPGANLRRAVNGRTEPEEVTRLQLAFRRMLERLEAERRRTSSAALAAQEEERARVARDLHDEVNQSLTALLLRLEAARVKAPVELAHELAETKALANQAMEELLMLARQLRPTALDDLGLKAALAGHVAELGRQGGIRTSFEAQGISPLCPPTCSSSSTGSPRRRSRTPPVTPAPRPRSLVRPPRATGNGSSSRSATTGPASPSTRRLAGWGSPACASGRCSSGATSRWSRGRTSGRGSASGCRWTQPIQR